MKPSEALALLGKATMKPFDDVDWDAFSGCESECPMIGYYGACTLVVDGDVLMVMMVDYGWRMFKLHDIY